MLACQENKSLYGHENVDKHNILYVNDSKKSLQLLSLDRHPAPAAKSESVIASISEKRAHICSLSACYNDMRQEVKASRIVSRPQKRAQISDEFQIRFHRSLSQAHKLDRINQDLRLERKTRLRERRQAQSILLVLKRLHSEA